MKVYGLWYGGCNYSAPGLADLEVFKSIKAAKRAFINRADGWDDNTRFPCVDEESAELHLFYNKPSELGDYVPDMIINFGSRGGIVATKY